jgi:MerR family transcriptional regulator, thiopeptide resistance regulator
MAKFERIIPILVYDDIPSAHDFLVDAFGFVSGGVQRTPDGVAVHGEVRAGDLLIWLHRASPEHNLASPRSQAVATGGLVVHIDDVDAHCAHARERGARVESEPQDQPYGQREYGARDLEGHRWWFASPLK